MTEPSRYDLHIHSHHSYDSFMSARTIVRVALRRGLAGIAVTDHGTIAGGLEVQRIAPSNLLVIVGAEIYTTVGDIVCLFLSREIVGRDPLDVIAQTHAQGGVAFLPHPMRSHPPLIPTNVLDACVGYEVLNARAGWFDPSTAPSGGTAWRALSSKARMANSDAHLSTEVGRAYTMIDGPSTVENVKRALLEGRTTAGGERVPPRNFYMSQLIKMMKTGDASMLVRLARRKLGFRQRRAT
jgi:predicted metal-dependent phosphoesterase TrpH